MEKKEIIQKLRHLIEESVEKSIGKSKKTGLLFSGGVDSTTLGFVMDSQGTDFICYTSGLKQNGLKESTDIIESKKIAKRFGWKHVMITADLEMAEKYAKNVIATIGSNNVIKVGVGIPLYMAMEKASKDGMTKMISGLGSEEIFAGYERHKKADDINEECKKGLLEMHHRDLTRDYAIAHHFGIELKMPFLYPKLVEFALSIPGNMKIYEEQNKLILREAAIDMGLPKKFAMRKKMGAQYGSRFDRAIQILAKKKGYRYKSDYLKSLK